MVLSSSAVHSKSLSASPNNPSKCTETLSSAITTVNNLRRDLGDLRRDLLAGVTNGSGMYSVYCICIYAHKLKSLGNCIQYYIYAIICPYSYI